MMPFKSVVNEFYAKDISRKTRAAFKIKAQNGEFTGSLPPYGYKRDPNNRHKLVPDEITADIAKKIFQLAVDAYNPYKIAQVLLKDKVLKPRLYDAFRKDKVSAVGIENPYKWGESSIVKIIKNPVYLGHMVSHRNVTKSYKIKKRVDIPTEEWIEVKNTHEPLVDEETFLLNWHKRSSKSKSERTRTALYKFSQGFLNAQPVVMEWLIPIQKPIRIPMPFMCVHIHAEMAKQPVHSTTSTTKIFIQL